ncbi:cytochrome oxidase c assembly-domain-containing protein [Lasiosphaeria ovina]|uniref:Cytochrome oxidase c assembly-domain-containing protein n=1 Tax=Lasiosphaeria ovina TaxID=92902 RepID=A0AAE0NAA4_9PEZI|nr:cytochrome oxidase c assembly-domain-containing protein [Lasiosphaeria ovina]
MPTISAPRSVSDATRFTPTTPHASSKAAAPRFTSAGGSSKGPGGAAPAGGAGGGGAGGGGRRIGGGPFTETPDQKVARLRAAHRRAKAAEISKFDKIVDGGRRFFDSAHKVTVIGLIGFTAIASLLTVYTAADMMMYNKKRKAEFIEAQKKLEADSLEAARLAYMTGKATEEQISLVEEVLEREREAGQTSGPLLFSKLPSLLGSPQPIGERTPAAAAAADTTAGKPQRVTEAATWPKDADSQQQQQPGSTKKSSGIWDWMTSTLKKEEEGDDAGTAQRRLGWESLSEEDDGAGVRDSDLVRAVEDKALAALEKEKANQRKGGPLDRVGLEAEAKPATAAGTEPKRKGWLW